MNNQPNSKRLTSGSWLVILVVIIGLIGVGGTWLRYHADNPTTGVATMTFENGEWIARATFAEHQHERLVVGTGVIITSREIPGHKMAGLIAELTPDRLCVVTVTSGPPPEIEATEFPCVVTVDAATTPVLQ